MRRIAFAILILFSVCTCSFAAGGHQPGRRIDMLKMTYGNKQLSLTSEEAEKFWPSYRNYLIDLKKARQQNRDDVLAQDESLLNTRRKYRDEFKRILNSDARANKALTLERDFNAMIRKELQQRMETRRHSNS